MRLPVSSSLPIYCKTAVRPKPDHRDPLNSVCGVIQRFGNEPPPVNHESLAELRRFIDLWLKRYLKPIEADEVLSFDDWINSAPYTENRREQLRQVYRCCNSHYAESGRLKKFRRCKSFVKDEAYDDFKKPRLINSRLDEAKCFCGPIFQQISDKLFELPPFIKKVPFRDRPMVIKESLMKPGAIYACDDYSAFESHFTAEVMKNIEFRLYHYMTKKLGQRHKLFMDFCYQCLAGTTKCRFQDFTATLKATRMSGEMNTSLGNGFSNLMVHLYLVWINSGRQNVVAHEMLNRIFIEGDDSIASYDSKSYIPTEEQFKKMGWTIKHEEYDNFGMASFCGAVVDPDDMTILCNPIKVLCGFGWTPRRYIRAGSTLRNELMRAKALSYLYQYEGCPIVDPFSRAVLRYVGDKPIRDSVRNAMEPHKREILEQAENYYIRPQNITLRSRLMMENKFGISIVDQLFVEISFIGLNGPFSIDSLINLIPKSWLRTRDLYVSSYYDNFFKCDVPYSSAERTLKQLKLHMPTPKILEKFKINKNQQNAGYLNQHKNVCRTGMMPNST